MDKPKSTRCPPGTRKDPKTGLCVPMTEDIKKHKQSLRNKHKGVVFDEEGNKVKPPNLQRTKKNRVPLKAEQKEEVKEAPKAEQKENKKKAKKPSEKKEEAKPQAKKSDEKQKRCPPGYERNKKTGECEKKKVKPSEKPDEKPRPKKVVETSETDSENEDEEKEAHVIEEEIDPEALVEASIDDPVEVVRLSQSEETEVVQGAVDPVEENIIQLVLSPPVEYEVDERGEVKPSMSSVTDDSSGPSSESPSESPSGENSRTLDEDVIKSELYPTLDDPNFSYKIAQRKEFDDTKYDGSIKNIKEQANRLCNAPFELLPHQLFVRNFLSFQTPYNSLLLYHGLGSGKTCSAIGIAEEMRAYMKQMGITKRIIIVASPNVQDNFRLQLFDERRLEQLPDGTWNLNTCIGNSLIKEINPTNLQGLTRDRIIAQIRSLINNFYVFMGNKGEFANYIRKAISIPADAGYTQEEAALMREKKIKAHFNNRLVILDEIHNSRISDANKTKLTSVLLNEIAKKSDNMRLLLLSATPMYNSYNEIIWLVNLLNANDKRPAIKVDQVFQPDGDWIRGPNGEEIGKDVLIRKLTGYVSYVRGENPYVFPYRIYPEIFDPERVFITESNQYPTRQMNQAPIVDPLQFIPVYKNEIGSYQAQGYQAIIDYLGLKSTVAVDKNGKERAMPTFENMESFGYTLLMAPLESLIIVYPNPVLDKLIAGQPKGLTESAKKEMIKSMIGKGGLMANLKFSRSEKPIPRRYDYEYKPKTKTAYGDIFAPENIGKYSAKIANICDIIRRPSSGIILIYSQFIDGGLVPMALALESMGFSRYASTPDHNRNLFKHSVDPVDALTMEPKKKGARGVARYVMITGEKDFSQNNNDDLKFVTNKSNADGSQVKVILISMAASEGLDFKNIRQIHILEPWYNMNRIEQIIGRGVRNLSHCDLEFEDRNVEIYLHGTSLDRDEEAADMYVYRSAEKKAVMIGRVTRVMKETAVDCQLNIGQTNFSEKKLLAEVANQSIEIRLSSRGDELIPFRVGDKPRTEVCDYMADCEFKCKKPVGPVDKKIIKNTYDENFIKNNSVVIMKKIRDLFMERMVYRRDHLISAINFIKKYPIEHIYYALTRFVQNKFEGLVDKYGRSGYLISRGEYYAFQPNEIMDETISVYERTVPVDYKPGSLRLELPKEFKPPAIEESVLDGRNGEAEAKPENGLTGEPSVAPSEADAPSAKPSASYEELMNHLKSVVQRMIKKDLSVKATDSDWYNHANKIVPELLTVHGIKSDLISKYVIFHFLDKLTLADKLVFVTRLYNGSPPSKNAYETIVRLYFDELVMKVEEFGELKTGVVLADGEVNRLFVKDEENHWFLAQFTDERLFEGVRKDRLVLPIEKINKTEIGFMHPFKGKDIVFKTKDVTQKRNNKGAKCTDSSKMMIAGKIAAIMGEPGLYKSTDIERPELCVLLEILMRWKTEATNTIYFFGPERTNEMKVVNLRV